jgi:hypothetical protein
VIDAARVAIHVTRAVIDAARAVIHVTRAVIRSTRPEHDTTRAGIDNPRAAIDSARADQRAAAAVEATTTRGNPTASHVGCAQRRQLAPSRVTARALAHGARFPRAGARPSARVPRAMRRGDAPFRRGIHTGRLRIAFTAPVESFHTRGAAICAVPRPTSAIFRGREDLPSRRDPSRVQPPLWTE